MVMQTDANAKEQKTPRSFGTIWHWNGTDDQKTSSEFSMDGLSLPSLTQSSDECVERMLRARDLNERELSQDILSHLATFLSIIR
jgi:hypothetical protein